MFQLLKGGALRRITAMVIAFCVIAVFPLSSMALERYEILMLGDRDAYVKELQKALYDKGYLKHAPTGYFGTDTQSAVLKFQKDHGLKEDGKAGPETRKAILGKNYKPISSSRSVKGKDKASAVKYEPGDKGTEIKNLQKRLHELEYYTYGKFTGYYGPATKTAVERFQRTNGLGVDGVLGEETISLLLSGEAKIYTIYPGEKSSDVKRLQQRLKELGYYKEKTVTGYFGDATEAAVKKFQQLNGLKADGKVGTNTRKAVYSDAAKKYTGAEKPEKMTSASKQNKVQKMLSIAKTQLGKRYVWSREGPDCFDCSGFVYYVIGQMGIHTTRYSADGFSKVSGWTKISSMDSLKPGDLLFWKNGSRSSRVGHTGIYLGEKKFIHASSSKKAVVISELKGYYEKNFIVARRIF